MYSLKIFIVTVVCFFYSLPMVFAQNEKANLGEPLEESLAYIFELFNEQENADEEDNDDKEASQKVAIVLDQEKLTRLIDFTLASDQSKTKDYVPSKRGDASGMYMSKEFKISFSKMSSYLFNLQIPGEIMAPSMVHFTKADKNNTFVKSGIDIFANATKKAKSYKYSSYESITPDFFSGGYYSYNNEILIITVPYKNSFAVIRASHQDKKSDIGRKGIILDDKKWIYFYSGLKGLTKGIISWANTYMYSGASVQIVVFDAQKKVVKKGIFKWLDAGWSGLNVVKADHIRAGTTRYFDTLAAIFENPKLPKIETFIKYMQNVKNLPVAEKEKLLKEYSLAYEKMIPQYSMLEKDDFKEILENGKYTDTMTAEDKDANLILEMFKQVLGKESLITRFSFLP